MIERVGPWEQRVKRQRFERGSEQRLIVSLVSYSSPFESQIFLYCLLPGFLLPLDFSRARSYGVSVCMPNDSVLERPRNTGLSSR